MNLTVSEPTESCKKTTRLSCVFREWDTKIACAGSRRRTVMYGPKISNGTTNAEKHWEPQPHAERHKLLVKTEDCRDTRRQTNSAARYKSLIRLKGLGVYLLDHVFHKTFG